MDPVPTIDCSEISRHHNLTVMWITPELRRSLLSHRHLEHVTVRCFIRVKRSLIYLEEAHYHQVYISSITLINTYNHNLAILRNANDEEDVISGTDADENAEHKVINQFLKTY
jgi:hypothetical protein